MRRSGRDETSQGLCQSDGEVYGIHRLRHGTDVKSAVVEQMHTKPEMTIRPRATMLTGSKHMGDRSIINASIVCKHEQTTCCTCKLGVNAD